MCIFLKHAVTLHSEIMCSQSCKADAFLGWNLQLGVEVRRILAHVKWLGDQTEMFLLRTSFTVWGFNLYFICYFLSHTQQFLFMQDMFHGTFSMWEDCVLFHKTLHFSNRVLEIMKTGLPWVQISVLFLTHTLNAHGRLPPAREMELIRLLWSGLSHQLIYRNVMISVNSEHCWI